MGTMFTPAAAHAQFTDRKVSHPLFKNVSQATAAEQLAAEEAGACVFRPSVRGPVALGLTIKLHDGPDGQPLFYHTDLDESGKVRAWQNLPMINRRQINSSGRQGAGLSRRLGMRVIQ